MQATRSHDMAGIRRSIDTLTRAQEWWTFVYFKCPSSNGKRLKLGALGMRPFFPPSGKSHNVGGGIALVSIQLLQGVMSVIFKPYSCFLQVINPFPELVKLFL